MASHGEVKDKLSWKAKERLPYELQFVIEDVMVPLETYNNSVRLPLEDRL
jgi:hypothetical protein